MCICIFMHSFVHVFVLCITAPYPPAIPHIPLPPQPPAELLWWLALGRGPRGRWEAACTKGIEYMNIYLYFVFWMWVLG